MELVCDAGIELVALRLRTRSVRSRHSSNSASATSIDGNGPPRSRAARRRAATNRSSESMVELRSAIIMRGTDKSLRRQFRCRTRTFAVVKR
jgi:hypothetical protein